MQILLALVVSLVFVIPTQAALLTYEFLGTVSKEEFQSGACAGPDFCGPYFFPDQIAAEPTFPLRGNFRADTETGTLAAFNTGLGIGIRIDETHPQGNTIQITHGPSFDTWTIAGAIFQDPGNTRTGALGPNAFTLSWDTEPNQPPSLGHIANGTYHIQVADSYRAFDVHGTLDAVLKPVPLPPAVWLFLSGVLALAGRRWIQTRKSSIVVVS